MRKIFTFMCVFASMLAFGQKGATEFPTDAGGIWTAGPGSNGEGGANSLTTLFGANNSFAGNTFDLVANGNFAITGFDINIDTTGSTQTASFYYRAGSSVGVENDPASWTLMGTDTGVVSAGPDVPTSVDVGGLVMAPGQTYGIYFDLDSYPGASVGYTNGGPNVYSNADLSLTTNTGQSSPAFSGSFFPRQWNGTVYYGASAEVPTLGSLGMIAFVVLLCAAAIIVRRRQATA
jgi:hypothetical protein